MVTAEARNQNPPPMPKTPYSAGVPPPKSFKSAITKPINPPKNKTQTIISRRVRFIISSIPCWKAAPVSYLVVACCWLIGPASRARSATEQCSRIGRGRLRNVKKTFGDGVRCAMATASRGCMVHPATDERPLSGNAGERNGSKVDTDCSVQSGGSGIADASYSRGPWFDSTQALDTR